MVVGEKHYKHIDEGPIRNVRRTRSPPAANNSEDSSRSSNDDDNGVRVGVDYQAVIPECCATQPCDSKAEAVMMWCPNNESLDIKVDAYLAIAKEKHGYNSEQALGMLFWHKHSVDKALSDLPNFTPFPDEWSVEDRVLFEQAFGFHGKSFHRIRQMLPDKSIGSLVKYYYSWKKTRCHTSLMDRQSRKTGINRECSDDDAMASSDSDSDFESSKEPKDEVKTSAVRSGPGARKSDSRARGKVQKPPRGMYLERDDLMALACGPAAQSDALLKQLDTELVSLKRQVQCSKQMTSLQKQKLAVNIDAYKLGEMASQAINPKWTSDELLLAVQGVRKYGRDFQSIAETIGTKTEAHVRSFFINYRRRYNLDEVVLEYEKEHGRQDSRDWQVEEMETDTAGVQESTGASSLTRQSASSSPPPLLRQAPLTATPSIAATSSKQSQPPPLQSTSKSATPGSSSAASRTILQQPPALFRQSNMPVLTTTTPARP